MPPSLRLSEALAEYEKQDIAAKGNADARSVVKRIVQFVIDKFDDPLLHEFDTTSTKRLDEMLPNIPNRKRIPREHARTLATRYDYAERHGWDGLERLTGARLKNGYHDALMRFFAWLIDKKLYPFEQPVFKQINEENLVSIERDAFSASEVEKIFSLPLFAGCKSAERIWFRATVSSRTICTGDT